MILEMTRPTQGGLRQERKLETVSNHLANADTTGFKRDVLSFDRTFKARLTKDFSQGGLRVTHNPLDMALEGEGFFKIETPDGICYTRNGSFSLDSQGILVDKNGNPVMGQGGAIILDEEPGNGILLVNENGEILLNNEVVDTLDIVTFENPNLMEKKGQNLLAYTGDTADELPAGDVRVKSGALEESNVKVVDEMVRMIDHQRMFEIYTKSLQTFDEIDSRAINDVGSTT